MLGVPSSFNSNPLVSIGMTVYNAQEYVDLSIQSLLGQDYANFELIISDNGSEDRTEEICRGYAAKDHRIIYSRNNTNINPLENADSLLNKSTGDYFMWAADHDIYHVEFIAKMIDQFKNADESTVLCYPDTCRIDTNNDPISVVVEDLDTRGLPAVERFKKVMWGLTYCTPIYGLYRMSVMKETWKVRRVTSPDRIYLPEFSLKGTFIRVPETLFYMRQNRPAENYRVMKKRQIKWFVNNEYEAIIPTVIRDCELMQIARESNLSLKDKDDLLADILKWHHAEPQKLSRNEIVALIASGTSELQSNEITTEMKKQSAKEYFDLADKCKIFRPCLKEELTELQNLCLQVIGENADPTDSFENDAQSKKGAGDPMDREPAACITPEIFNDEFYYEIRRLSSAKGIKHILEIGSSTGQGSTSAFVQGIKRGGETANLYCMEMNASRFEQLKNRYQNQAYVHCYRTSTVPLERYPQEREIVDFYNTTPTALQQYPIEQVLGWLRQDRTYLEKNDLPGDGIQMIKKKHNIKHFDLVLIDGSEFTGSVEMDDVYGAKVILLDDINTYKNYDNYHRLLLDPAYELEKKNMTLRNGYAIFRKVAHPAQLLTNEGEAPRISMNVATPERVEGVSKPMHVVIDGVIFQHQAERPHGIARVWQNLIAQLMRQNGQHKITLLQRDGFEIPVDPISPTVVPAYQWGDPQAMDNDDQMLHSVCKRLGADMFMSTYYTRAPGVQNIVMVYDMIPELMEMDLSLPEWVSKNRALETGDGFICISQATQADLVNYYPYLCKRPMQVTHLGIENVFNRPSAESVIRFRDKYKLDRPYILLVGNRQGYKNGVDFLTALKGVSGFDLPDVVCVGGESQLSNEERALQEQMRLRYLGHLSDQDLVAAYGSAEALFVPSLHEGFGLPVLEAMRCGCPVVANHSTAVAEIGGDAVTFADLSSGQAIREILESIKDKTQHQDRIKKGLAHTANYEWSATARSVSGFLMAQMVKRQPMITAIVSTYNAAEYIRGCLEDLQNQTIAHQTEIIVVDSGSEQEEAAIVRDFQARHNNIKYIRTHRETVYQAWNRSITFALGAFITNANTDDRHRKDAFEKMAAALNTNETVALVYADVLKTLKANQTFNGCVPSGVFRWPDWNRQQLLTDGCFMGPQPMWRKKVHDDFGYFDENYQVSADFEFWLRISQTYDFFHIGQPLGLYLDRPDSVEHANSEIKQNEDRQIFETYRKAANAGEIIGKIKSIDAGGDKEALGPIQATLASPTKHNNQSKTATDKQGENTMGISDTMLSAMQYLLDGGHDEAARWTMDKLVCEDPHDTNLQFQAGQMAYQASDWQQAKSHFETAVRLAPQNATYLKCLGDYYYVVEKNPQKALAQYERVLQGAQQHIEVLTLAGHIATSLQRYADAKAYYQRVLEVEPNNSKIKEMLHKLPCHTSDALPAESSGSKCRNRADLHEAMSQLENTIEQDDNNAAAHNDLGVHHYECGNMDAAQRHYEQAVTMQPENIIFQKNLADFYLAVRSDHERALSIYVQVLKLDPLDIEAQLSCSQICIALGKEVDARDFIKAVLLIDPSNADAQQLLDQIDGSVFDNRAEASGSTLYAEAQAMAAAGDLAGAISKLEALAITSPDNAEALNHLGVLYYENGDKEKALHYYEQACIIEPQNHNYCKNLADIYLVDFDRTEDAMKLYLRVLENNPNDVESLLGSGLVCSSIGKPDDARVFYQRALKIDPSNGDAQGALNNLAA